MQRVLFVKVYCWSQHVGKLRFDAGNAAVACVALMDEYNFSTVQHLNKHCATQSKSSGR